MATDATTPSRNNRPEHFMEKPFLQYLRPVTAAVTFNPPSKKFNPQVEAWYREWNHF
jgi:hypothetical protein